MTATMERAQQEQRDITIQLARGGYDPGETYPILTKEAFEIPDPERGKDDEPRYADYLAADDVARTAAALIARHPEDFRHLTGANIVYRWKREGGKHAGKLTFGRCVRLDGIQRHFAGADFLVWLAADHCRSHRVTAKYVEALTYHELLHIGLSDADNPSLTLVPHDFEGFSRELAVYGMWHRDLRVIGNALQMPLPMDGAR